MFEQSGADGPRTGRLDTSLAGRRPLGPPDGRTGAFQIAPPPPPGGSKVNDFRPSPVARRLRAGRPRTVQECVDPGGALDVRQGSGLIGSALVVGHPIGLALQQMKLGHAVDQALRDDYALPELGPVPDSRSGIGLLVHASAARLVVRWCRRRLACALRAQQVVQQPFDDAACTLDVAAVPTYDLRCTLGRDSDELRCVLLRCRCHLAHEVADQLAASRVADDLAQVLSPALQARTTADLTGAATVPFSELTERELSSTVVALDGDPPMNAACSMRAAVDTQSACPPGRRHLHGLVPAAWCSRRRAVSHRVTPWVERPKLRPERR